MDIFALQRDVSIEMLRLCKNDNLAARDWLGALLVQAGRYKEAVSCSQFWIKHGEVGVDFSTPPDKTPLSQKMVREHWTKADTMYSAALAAFCYWGDCLLARQYILIAVRLNPQILLKILAKIDRPSESCVRPSRLTQLTVASR